MLTEAEVDALDRLSMSAVLAITAVMGLSAVPSSVRALQEAMPEGCLPQFGFGSHLSDKYGKELGLKLPVATLQSTGQAREEWMTATATLVASGLLGSAYELLKPHRDPNNALWEFFRHTRNAAFHGNRFYFKGGEPLRPASWRGRELSNALDEQPLFFEFLQFGDAFFMLADLILEIGMPHDEPPLLRTAPTDWTF